MAKDEVNVRLANALAGHDMAEIASRHGSLLMFAVALDQGYGPDGIRILANEDLDMTEIRRLCEATIRLMDERRLGEVAGG